MADSNEIIHFPYLVDSQVKSGIITLNQDFQNTKERLTEISLQLEGTDQQRRDLKFFCDYPNLVNLNYKMKSACNQITEAIKTMENK